MNTYKVDVLLVSKTLVACEVTANSEAEARRIVETTPTCQELQFVAEARPNVTWDANAVPLTCRTVERVTLTVKP